MGKYVYAIWRSRFFWFSLVKKDLRTRYRRSMLGVGWSLLHPLMMAAVICIVFHQILHLDVRHYGLSLLTGLAFWNCLTFATLQGCQSFFHGEAYIRQQPAPLAIYPLRITLGATIHFTLALLMITLLAGIVQANGFHPLALFSLAPTLLLVFVFCWSLATLAALATVFFQDTQHLSEVGFQILFYMTPIIYDPRVLGENKIGWVIQWNPLTVMLHLIRDPIVEGSVPSLRTYATAAAIVGATATVAVLALVRFQRRVIFYL